MSQTATPLETIIYRDDDSAISVSALFIPGMLARRDEYGAPESPDDDPDIEIVNAYDEDGHEVELTDDEEAEAMEQLWDGDKA